MEISPLTDSHSVPAATREAISDIVDAVRADEDARIGVLLARLAPLAATSSERVVTAGLRCRAVQPVASEAR